MAAYNGTGSKTGRYGHIQFMFSHQGSKHYQLVFTAGMELECRPHIRVGQRDSVWVTRGVDVDSYEDVSRAAGMHVLEREA